MEISETDLVEELKHGEDVGEEEDNIETLETWAEAPRLDKNVNFPRIH